MLSSKGWVTGTTLDDKFHFSSDTVVKLWSIERMLTLHITETIIIITKLEHKFYNIPFCSNKANVQPD